MSNQALTWVLNDEDLPQGPKMVMVAIANHADHTDGYCYLKATTIAKEAACTERAVFRVIAALIRNGYIRREKRRGADGKQRANDYWILMDRKPAPWAWTTAKATIAEEDETQYVVGADDGMTETTVGNLPPPESCGPHDSAGLHTLYEPPYSKPKGNNLVLEESKRRYRSPPQALEVAASEERVTVIAGTRWWAKMQDYWLRNYGVRWQKSVPLTGEHAGKTGWWFRKSDLDAALKRDDGVDDKAAAEFAAAS